MLLNVAWRRHQTAPVEAFLRLASVSTEKFRPQCICHWQPLIHYYFIKLKITMAGLVNKKTNRTVLRNLLKA